MAQSLSRSGYYFFHAFLCLSLLSVSLRVVKAAGNIDVLEPIVRISPVRGTLGGAAPPANSSEDYFGFSVALHQVKVPGSFEEALNNTRIIVGAPKGTYPGGLNLAVTSTPVNETGLVYDCPVRSGSCGRIGSGEDEDARLFDPDNDIIVPTSINSGGDQLMIRNVMELKSGQQMGATLVSSGELFVACAPQFTISFLESDSLDFDRRRKIGRCFYSQRNLTGFREMRPCVPTIGGGATENRCVAGTSAAINQNDNQMFISLGAPGASDYQGEAFLYQVSDGSTTGPIDAEFGRSALVATTNNLYETYSMITGNITGGAFPDYITSLPRANGSDYKGLVSVRKNLFDVTKLTVAIRGSQLAEYFGYSLAAADLNGDGYDEVIVGAPIYSDSERNIQEIGRVYVFRNNGGNISDDDPIVLPGDRIARARFGSSVINIGDVNDDGYEDIAVGAPYQELGDGNSGKVYIYYGSPSFIDPIPDQTILASDVALTTGQRQLRTFGWSLTSGVDVDNNQYLDLLVGAYESGTAVLFRTLSVARIEISASSDLVDNVLPIDLNVATVSFNLRLCASFSGRGLTGSLETMLNVDEVVEQGGTGRLLFEGNEVYSQPFFFPAANQPACSNISVSIRSKESLFAGGVTTVRDFQIRFSMTQEPRVTPPGYNGNPSRLSDLRDTPILIVGGNDTYTVIPNVSCEDGGCEPDLAISIINRNYIYVSTATTPSTIYPDVVAGSTGVDRIITPLRIENRNPDAAIGTTLRISIPMQFDFFSSNNMSCSAVGGGNLYDCNLPVLDFIGGGKSVDFNLTWSRRSNIRGTEREFPSMVMVITADDMDTTNNRASTTVMFGAISDVEVTSVRLIGPSTYNDQTPPSPLTRIDELGERVTLTAQLQNRGPSTLNSTIPSSAQLIIRIPTQDATTGTNYYLYPGSYSVSNTRANVTCDRSDFNPLNLDAATRRKRSLRMRRQDSAGQDSNPIPQDSLIKNCNADRVSCMMNEINCTIKDWSPNQPITITVFSYLDRRFFATRSNPFTFVAEAEIAVVSTVTRDSNDNNNVGVSNPYSIQRMAQDGNNTITIIVPIVAAIAAVIIIIALFCILFFCGFFRRKKFEKEEPEEMQVREVPPEEGEVVNGGKPGPPPGDEEVAPDKETTPTKDPLENDIGDASDLQDGEIAAVEADPDETSL